MTEEEETIDVSSVGEGAAEILAAEPGTNTITEEDKAERLKRAEERIKQRKLEIQEEERQREIEREKSRRKDGQDLGKIKSEMEWREAQKLAEEKKREKREDRLAKQRVLDEIARDRANMKEKQAKIKLLSPEHSGVNPKISEKEERQRIKDEITRDRENMRAQSELNRHQQSSSNTSSSSMSKSQTPKMEYNKAKLQIRLPDNTKLIQSFGADEPLSAVRLYIDMNSQDIFGPFIELSTSYPRKIFSEDEMQMSLRALGLLPNAVLLATKAKDVGTAI